LHGQRIGYVRVSSFDQNRTAAGTDPGGKVFTDKASGKDTQRPELERLLAFVREGDTVVVHSMDRLARNLDDLRRSAGLTQRGVRIEFVKGICVHRRGLADGEPDAVGHGRVRRVRARLDPAAARGHRARQAARAYRGRKKSLSSEQIAELRQRVRLASKRRKLAREFGISRETLYQYLREPDP
jgi:DNA invertase Pin-like site-specific DNA recombinase